MLDTENHPILRTYRVFKSNFDREYYLDCVKQPHFRSALCKFRTSSHDLRIKTGRHSKTKLPLEQRLCTECNVIEDEKHLLLKCSINLSERINLYSKLSRIYPDFVQMTDDDKFALVMTATCAQTLTLLGKCVYRSFKIRKQQRSSL